MISAVVVAKNEARDIVKCLESLKWCSERIVIDNSSKDKTAEIVKKAGAKVTKFEGENDFSALRQFGLEQAQNDWVLFIDSDEIVFDSLAYEITSVLSHNLENYSGFSIPRIDTIWGKELSRGENSIKLIRLGKKERGKWIGKVHEVWKIKGKVGILETPIMHYPYESIAELWQKIDYYSTLRAEELYSQGKKSSFLSILFLAKAKFIQDYFLKLGFLDGIPGLLVAISMSFHSFLTRAKLFLLWNKK